MAAEMVGGAFLSSLFQVLIDRLASSDFLTYFRKRKRDDHDNGKRLVEKLKTKLKVLEELLDDAEKQQITKQSVKNWVDDLKDVVYQADDLVDEIETKILQFQTEAAYQSGASQQVRVSTFDSLFDDEMVSKIQEILDRLEDFDKESKALDLKVVSRVLSEKRWPTTSLVIGNSSDVCGRDDDKEKIIQLLLSDSEDDHEASGSYEIDVIPIVGMGGLGKTTLAQLVYNDVRVSQHFDTKSWACVSDDFDVVEVTRTILEEVSSRNYSDTKDLNRLQVKLKESLTGKKFLIVLDDVWNENSGNWDILRTPFNGAKCGSKIIVTTRNLGVASIMQTVPVHRLQLLSDEACWSLFAKIAFHKGVFSDRTDLEKIGKEIVIKRCKGLPLAVKTLAGLLRSKHDVEEWNDVLKSDIWDLPEDKNNILPVLRLSYHDLPSHLKQCFAYCSIFPKDYELEKENLVLLWIAQNFVESKNNRTPEKIGNEYFHELLSRSFFQPLSNKKSSFVMHDLIHDLAQDVSGQFSYRSDGTKQHHTSLKARHFSYVRSDEYDGYEKFEAINEVRCLRTFLPLGKTGRIGDFFLKEMVLNDILPAKRCLRVLSLMKYEIEVLSNSFVNLIHLRYLDLSYTAIKQLPEWVCTLYNLQTLLLSHCHSLTTLPGEIVKLVHLRHLDIFGTKLSEMPLQMSRLKGLNHLTAFVVGKRSGSSINELKEFHHLAGKLSISCLQNVSSGMDTLEAKLKEKKHLEELLLEWGSDTSDTLLERDVLENLQPHTNLKSLEIINYGGTRFPNWLGNGSYTNIVTVRLANCKYCLSLPPLGQLSSLKNLIISRMDGITEVGPEFYGNCSLIKPFQSLETLRIENMSEWEEWHHPSDDGVCFRQLLTLRVLRCPKLVGGLPKDIPSWVSVEIDECPQLKAFVPKTCATTSGGELVLRRCDGVKLGWQGLSSSLVKLVISGMQNLEELAPELCTLTNLKELSIYSWPRLLSFPHTGLPPNLTKLDVGDLRSFVFELSSSTASGCSSSSLVSSASNGLPLTLKSIRIKGCRKLVFPPLSEEIVGLEELFLENINDTPKTLPLGLFPKLQSLNVRSCENFETFLVPCSGLGLQNLTSLVLAHCGSLIELPQRMHTLLPSLEHLRIVKCPEIESFPDGGLPSSLRELMIYQCKKLAARRREWNLQTLPSLTFFSFHGEDGDEDVPFPEEGLLPSTTLTDLGVFQSKSLRHLTIALCPQLQSLPEQGFPESLSSLEISSCDQLQSLPEKGFPESLSSLNIYNCPQIQSLPEKGFPESLSSLEISLCPQLKSLPEKGLPASLSKLYIEDCPLLKDRCQRDIGDDWRKIAHIPFINIDGNVIC